MKNNIYYLSLFFLLNIYSFGANPHPVPKLKDMYQPWLFARVSEASSLFIEPQYKNKVPYAHIVQTGNKIEWIEFNGSKFERWEVSKYKESNKDLTLYLIGGSKVLITPFWDIDQCLLIIRFTLGEEDNPTRFSVPYQLLSTIPYMKGDG